MVGLCCAWGEIKCGIESPSHPQSVSQSSPWGLNQVVGCQVSAIESVGRMDTYVMEGILERTTLSTAYMDNGID